MLLKCHRIFNQSHSVNMFRRKMFGFDQKELVKAFIVGTIQVDLHHTLMKRLIATP